MNCSLTWNMKNGNRPERSMAQEITEGGAGFGWERAAL
jgi:hypothetical protein